MMLLGIDIVYWIAVAGLLCVLAILLFVRNNDRVIPDPEKKNTAGNVFIIETEKGQLKANADRKSVV